MHYHLLSERAMLNINIPSHSIGTQHWTLWFRSYGNVMDEKSWLYTSLKSILISTFSIFVSLEVATSHHVDWLFEDHNSLSLFVVPKRELLVSYSLNCNPSWYLPVNLPDLQKIQVFNVILMTLWCHVSDEAYRWVLVEWLHCQKVQKVMNRLNWRLERHSVLV